MKTQKDVNSYTYTPVYGTNRREGNYPSGPSTSETGAVIVHRKLVRSTGQWKPGEGKRKPEQPYVNTLQQYSPVRGTIVAFERDTGYGEHKHTFTGYRDGSFTEGFNTAMIPAWQGGSVSSFPAWDDLGVNPDLLSQAETKALNKLDQFAPSRGDASVDFAVAAGERRETGRMLKDATFGVLNLARACAGFSSKRGGWEFGAADALRSAFGINVHPAELRRRYGRRMRRLETASLRGEITRGALTASLMADMWLTYRLGVTPLMSELDGLYNIVKHQPADPSNFTFKVSARHYRERGGLTERGIDYKSSGKQQFFVQELHGYTVTLCAAPNKQSMSKLTQFGLDNLPASIWELTTFTFVVDYFVNVGDFLQALNVPKRFEFVDGSWTQRIVRIYSMVLSGPGTKARGFASTDHMHRHVYGTFPVPMPPLSLNGEDLTLKRFVTMAALAVVKLRKLLQ